MSASAPSPNTSTVQRVPRKGQKSGIATEYTGFFRIKPGHAKKLVEEITSALTRRGDVRTSYASIGVYDARYVLFDNNSRLLLTIAFDKDFDTYFDDAFMMLFHGDLGKTGANWIDNLEGAPTSGTLSLTWEDVKNWLVSHQVEASIYANTAEAPVKELKNAYRLQTVFQKVLDNPAAADALASPALKPLLDEAAG